MHGGGGHLCAGQAPEASGQVSVLREILDLDAGDDPSRHSGGFSEFLPQF
jgi:hypothetical protein